MEWTFKPFTPTLHQLFIHLEQPAQHNNINLYQYPIIAELTCKAGVNKVSPYIGFSTFITVHQPSCTFVVSNNRRERDDNHPIVYRYGKLVRECDTKQLSQRLGQKIFPKWNTPADQFNGNSRTTLKILWAYVIITPNAPCRLNTDPYVQPACTAKPPPANNKAQTPQKPPNLDCTSQAPSPRMAAAMASGDQTQNYQYYLVDLE